MHELIRAERLEAEAREIRKRYKYREERESLINIGVIIYDIDANKLARVSGLKKGCIDFSADYLDGSYSRGYTFVVNNWRLATQEELNY